jgi:hypothetical protein
VGIGHNLTAHGRPVRRYAAVEVERLFMQDFSVALDSCRKGIEDFDSLPVNLQILCISVHWGVGRTGFARFHDFRLAMSHRAYLLAASELRLSKWATQVSRARRDHHVALLNAQ